MGSYLLVCFKLPCSASFSRSLLKDSALVESGDKHKFKLRHLMGACEAITRWLKGLMISFKRMSSKHFLVDSYRWNTHYKMHEIYWWLESCKYYQLVSFSQVKLHTETRLGSYILVPFSTVFQVDCLFSFSVFMYALFSLAIWYLIWPYNYISKSISSAWYWQNCKKMAFGK